MERNTRQRQAIAEAIVTAGRPLLPQEILERARAAVPSLSLATVYRNLKQLVEDGELRSVALPGDVARYEPAGSAHHHHFQCRQCERVYDVPGCPDHLGAMVPRGFTVEDHEITLYGRCADCQRLARHARRGSRA
ncbi:Fur family transcriptional regulator [Azohydromonas sediminis]|uniref:Fur family transcriptional regulator n=1 Tax=Azohydromonas sediminis TaxID=2259674 RepID=UPI000E65D246|nr:transcriptional repressor [Azohydromonas sediminis]